MITNTLESVHTARLLAQSWTTSLDRVSHFAYGDTAESFGALRATTLSNVADQAGVLAQGVGVDVTSITPKLLDYLHGTAFHAARGNRDAARSDAAMSQRMLANLEGRLTPDHGAPAAGTGPRL